MLITSLGVMICMVSMLIKGRAVHADVYVQRLEETKSVRVLAGDATRICGFVSQPELFAAPLA